MAKSIITLAGVGETRRDRTGCRCVLNKRTGRGVEICRVPKSKKHRSGTAFVGSCDNPQRK